MSGYIDIVCNPYTPWVLDRKLMGVDEDFKTQVRMSDDMRNGVEIEEYDADEFMDQVLNHEQIWEKNLIEDLK